MAPTPYEMSSTWPWARCKVDIGADWAGTEKGKEMCAHKREESTKGGREEHAPIYMGGLPVTRGISFLHEVEQSLL